MASQKSILFSRVIVSLNKKVAKKVRRTVPYEISISEKN